MTEALPTARPATGDPAAPPPGWDAHVHVFGAGIPVLAGHYAPSERPLEEIEALAAAHGVGHLVLVQPSVYGTDNSLLLQALRRQPGRHRGVAVVDAGVADAELATLHAAGVRGVRFNLVSPVGVAALPQAALQALSPRLRALGWHVQWYAQAPALPAIAALQRETGLVFVLDHLAGLHAGVAADDAAWAALQALADAGAWVKLSGWYRLRAAAPYTVLDARIARVAALFGPRLVWGSDWPHTSFAPAQAPAYADTWAPVPRVLGPERAHALREQAAATLYR